MYCTISHQEARFCTRKPTRRQYKQGCRCEAAVEANSQYMQKWRNKNRNHVRQYARDYMRKKRHEEDKV